MRIIHIKSEKANPHHTKSKPKNTTFDISLLACVTDKHISNLILAHWPPNYHKTSQNMTGTPNQLVNKNKQQIKISRGKTQIVN